MEAFPTEAIELVLKHELKRCQATWHFSENTDQCFMKITWTKTPNITPIKLEDGDSEMPKELSSISLSAPLCKSIKRELIQQGSSNQDQGSHQDLSGSWTMLTQSSNNQSSSFFNVSPKLDPYGDDVIFMGISITEPIEIYENEDEDIVYISTSKKADSNNSDVMFVKQELPKQPGNQSEDSAADKATRNPVKDRHRRLSDPQSSPGTSRHKKATSRHKKARSTVSTSTPKPTTLCPARKQTTDRNNNSANRSDNSTIEILTTKSTAVQTLPKDGMATQLREKLAFVHNINGRFFAIYETDYLHNKEIMLVYKIGWNLIRSYERDVEPEWFFRVYHDFTLAKDAYHRSYIHIFGRLKGYLRAAMRR